MQLLQWVLLCCRFEYIQQIYIVVYLMAMSNSMYNPIIYCLMNARWVFGIAIGQAEVIINSLCCV